MSGMRIVATFSDGAINTFDLGALRDDAEYKEIAAWAGYADAWQSYGIEHELTHHWLATRLGWPWSWSLHDNPPQPWPPHVAWEEHLVNRLQRYMMTGKADEFNVLERVFAYNLWEASEALHEELRRWRLQLGC